MEETLVYRGHSYYEVEVEGLKRRLPIVEVSPRTFIASDAELILGDVEFIEKAAKALSNKIKKFSSSVVVTPEAKAIALAYEVSRNLGHKKFVVARKSLKAYMKNYLVEPVSSITTTEEQKLILTDDDIALIKGKGVCILDDVVSTGGTIKALEKLVQRAGGEIVCKAAIWKEGPWYKDKALVFLSKLPIFIGSET
ncbi:MAG: phosphoribosyltransferase [Candidatus Brockarchaeota archaeon]|nr:phosphoribosyltransferase [Candidatus Brockarchaeota archaeon]